MRALIVVACALMCSGCMQEVVHFAAKPQQQAMVRDGEPVLVSQKQNSVVMIRPAKRQFQAGGRPIFVVAVRNLTKQPVDFLVKDIVATQIAAGSSVPMKVFSYEDLVAEEKTRQVVAAVLVGAVAGANSAVAARYGGYSNRYSTSYTSGGVSTRYTTSYSSTAAIAAQNRAMRQNDKMIDAAIDQGQANLARLERDVLKDNTLLPGEWYGGTLSLQPPTEAAGGNGHKTYSIVLTVGADHHEIDVVQDSQG